jgi:ankyrin repeat protein
VNFKSLCGTSLLLKPVIYGSSDIVKFLLEAGADPNIPDMVIICRPFGRALYGT